MSLATGVNKDAIAAFEAHQRHLGGQPFEFLVLERREVFGQGLNF